MEDAWVVGHIFFDGSGPGGERRPLTRSEPGTNGFIHGWGTSSAKRSGLGLSKLQSLVNVGKRELGTQVKPIGLEP